MFVKRFYDTVHVEYLEVAIDEHLHGLGKIIVGATDATILYSSFEFIYRHNAVLKKEQTHESFS